MVINHILIDFSLNIILFNQYISFLSQIDILGIHIVIIAQYVIKPKITFRNISEMLFFLNYISLIYYNISYDNSRICLLFI